MYLSQNIVVLDGFTLNPGDLSWDELEALGLCTVYDRTLPEDIVQRARDAAIVLTNKAVLDRSIIESLPNLRYIGIMATGYNVVDLEAARERGIPVTNVPEYATGSVVQHVFALLLELTQHVGLHSASVHSGEWTSNADFSYWKQPLIELEGLTIGVVGFGRIGKTVTQMAITCGMPVLVTDVTEIATGDPTIQFVDLDKLLRESDVVTLHCPLTPETAGMINDARIGLMKSSAYFINTSRGPLVDEAALAKALSEGRIAGAGLDVLSIEPPLPDNPLLSAPNCYITPHIAWATQASRRRLMAAVTANVKAFMDGVPRNVVNGV